MKGIVFSIKPNKNTTVVHRGFVLRFFKTHIFELSLSLLLILGAVIGFVISVKLSGSRLVDIILGFFGFIKCTTFPAAAINIFTSLTTPAFLIIFAMYFCGASPLGTLFIPFLLMLKGLSVSTGIYYLMKNYSFYGLLFYLAVFLIGDIIFCACAVKQARLALTASKSILLSVYFKRDNLDLRLTIREFTVSSLYSLLTCGVSVLITTVLHFVFTNIIKII